MKPIFNKNANNVGSVAVIPVGGSPTGTGGSPVLPIIKANSQQI